MSLNLLKPPILFVLLYLVNPFPLVEPRTLEASTTPFVKTLQNLRGAHKGQRVKGVCDLRGFLQKYGYIRKGSSLDDNFDESVESALKHYQTFHRLLPTGLMDDETIKKMSLPRCGFPDIITQSNNNPNNSEDPENYSFFPGSPKWSQYHLTYEFALKYSLVLPVSITRQEVEQSMRSAFLTWEAASKFTFMENKNAGLVSRSNISYGFHAFDGPGGVLAHAFAPEIGKVHFDINERWNTNGSDIDMESVCGHEIGHSLGLAHSNDRDSIMQPFYSGVKRDLGQDDIDGLNVLYNNFTDYGT